MECREVASLAATCLEMQGRDRLAQHMRNEEAAREVTGSGLVFWDLRGWWVEVVDLLQFLMELR